MSNFIIGLQKIFCYTIISFYNNNVQRSKQTTMAWSRGLRGSNLEETINLTNEVYKKKNLAIIQKIPTPITPMKIDKEKKHITLAYFDQKSTVDYIGIAQGVPICFDAKETSQKNFPLQNIHPHQIEFMEHFIQHQGLAFILVYFSLYKEYYCLTFDTLKPYWNAAQNGTGRKSIPYADFDKDLLIPQQGIYINYLETIAKLLE